MKIAVDTVTRDDHGELTAEPTVALIRADQALDVAAGIGRGARMPTVIGPSDREDEGRRQRVVAPKALERGHILTRTEMFLDRGIAYGDLLGGEANVLRKLRERRVRDREQAPRLAAI